MVIMGSFSAASSRTFQNDLTWHRRDRGFFRLQNREVQKLEARSASHEVLVPSALGGRVANSRDCHCPGSSRFDVGPFPRLLDAVNLNGRRPCGFALARTSAAGVRSVVTSS
jgi:hypothetical protein